MKTIPSEGTPQKVTHSLSRRFSFALMAVVTVILLVFSTISPAALII